MKLSRTVAYAIRAVLELAKSEPNHPTTCSEIARRGEMPERFLLQILRSLVSHGVLCSVQGVSGGYYLARAPETITLLDIVESFEEQHEPTIPELPNLPAAVHQRLTATLVDTCSAACNELNKLTIAELSDNLH